MRYTFSEMNDAKYTKKDILEKLNASLLQKDEPPACDREVEASIAEFFQQRKWKKDNGKFTLMDVNTICDMVVADRWGMYR